MGHGTYSAMSHSVRSDTLGYHTKDIDDVFKQNKLKTINSSMNPHGITVREARDSTEHPNSLAIVLGLDVTGSMGSIPHFLVKDGLPELMTTIIDKGGIKDPQLLFLGIGDHEFDSFPLQVGQFESSDELLDKWLTDLYLEGGGGGNWGESYMLAWYFASQHTAIDCLEKRGQKGMLITIGDEPVLKTLPKAFIKNMMGDGQHETFESSVLLDNARKMYHVFHVHIKQTSAGSKQEVMDGWRQLLNDNLIICNDYHSAAKTIAQTIKQCVSTKEQSDSTPML